MVISVVDEKREGMAILESDTSLNRVFGGGLAEVVMMRKNYMEEVGE